MSKSCDRCERLEAALRAARSRLVEIGQHDFASPKTIEAIDSVLVVPPCPYCGPKCTEKHLREKACTCYSTTNYTSPPRCPVHA
jgi:hypothetical protein